MKKLLHGLSGALIYLTPIVWGGLLIYGNGVEPDFRDFLFDFMQNAPLAGVGIGLALILFVLVHLGTFGLNRSRKTRYLSFESEGGSVSIGINAVRDFIRKLGDEFDAVVAMEPKIRTVKDTISIDLDVKIQAGSLIPELSKTLQNRVRESIRDGLGIAEVREIKVNVQEIVGAPPPASFE